ncbi:TonB-dependent receptor plug domain-containing protein, partial [Marinilabilia sp.]|uniref:TonB-dependent receptor n=1 Tax=Marinilabilia sp. TaxID=2021252 RepID=UPI0025C44CB4
MLVDKRFLILFFWLFLCLPLLRGQAYKVEFTEKPLNKALIELRQEYDVRFSFDDRYLSNFSVSASGKFSSFEEILNVLLIDLPLQWEVMGNVYVIYRRDKPVQPSRFLISGQVLEKNTGEPLSFSHVQIGNHQMIADVKGSFSFVSREDSAFQVKASYLGCFVVDTILYSGQNHRIYLTPFSYDLPEVIVRDNIVARSIQMGEQSGMISLNTYIANYLPGNGDNAVFNLLRLQPGVVAAGEQANDLIIWGSYEGTSRVRFDGITIWGLKNFNDNISAINPFMTKNVEVLKGGYDASHEDLAGGVVNITGKTGRRNRRGFHLFINNETLNGMVETPLSEKSSLTLAYRQTYYDLFDADDITNSSSDDLEYRILVKPDYRFRDFNAKYSLQQKDGSLFYISLLGGDDDFAYTAEQERQRNVIYQSTSEENHQLGGAMYWGKSRKNGDHYQFNAAWSGLFSTYAVERKISNARFNRRYIDIDKETETNVGEGSLKFDYNFQLLHNQRLTVGIEGFQNRLSINEDSAGLTTLDSDYSGARMAAFLFDRISLSPQLHLKPGLRYNYSFYTGSNYLDPRVELSFRPGGTFSANAAWGSYHQFLVKNSMYDETGNFRYVWSLSDGQDLPVLDAQHWVLGGSWKGNNFTINIDGFYKTVNGLTRYVRFNQSEESVYRGEGFSYGLDVFLKKDFDANSVWVSYSLAHAQEQFSYFQEDDFRRAPHDQRHELKFAGLMRFLKRFHFSAAYVYGSGFPLYANYLSEQYTEPDYS